MFQKTRVKACITLSESLRWSIVTIRLLSGDSDLGKMLRRLVHFDFRRRVNRGAEVMRSGEEACPPPADRRVSGAS